nr:hypothetical protein GCM10020092_064150 [Actinoplanes digitatis]
MSVAHGCTARPGERPDRYGMMFVLLLASFVVAGMLDGRLARLITLVFYVVVLVLALRFARLSAGTARWLRRMLLAGSVVVAALVVAVQGPVIEGIAALWTAGFLLLTVFVVVGRVLRHRVVTMQTIFGALSAYLLVGFFFVALFTAAAMLGPGPFFAGGRGGRRRLDPVLRLHHPDHHRVRRPDPGHRAGAQPCGAGRAVRPDLPRDAGGPARLGVRHRAAPAGRRRRAGGRVSGAAGEFIRSW